MAPIYTMRPLSDWQLSVAVAWICILPKEYDSGRLLFDERYSYEEKGITDYDDDNRYELGRIGNHEVVMNCPRPGNTGHYQAHETVIKMLRTFPNIRASLLVGIGGGVPNLKKSADVRLGDVVVSHEIITYQTGRMTATGLVMKPRPVEVEKSLCAAASNFRSDMRQNEALLQEMVRQAASQQKNWAIYSRPRTDNLFVSDYLHREKCQCQLVQPRDQSIMVPRQDRPKSSLLKMHLGKVGSADQLLVSACERDRLSNTDDIICVEMEAAVVTRGNCITVRGISDYCDSHKNDGWHDYAAFAAAVCAKELLQRTPPSKFTELRRYMTPQECYSLVHGVIQRLRDELAHDPPQEQDLAVLNRMLEVIDSRSGFIKNYAQDHRFQKSTSDGNDGASTAKQQATEATKMAANIEALQQELNRLVKKIETTVKHNANTAPSVTRHEWEELKAKVDHTAREVETLQKSKKALQTTAKALEELAGLIEQPQISEIVNKGRQTSQLIEAMLEATKAVSVISKPAVDKVSTKGKELFNDVKEKMKRRTRAGAGPARTHSEEAFAPPTPDPSLEQDLSRQHTGTSVAGAIENTRHDWERNINTDTILDTHGTRAISTTPKNASLPPVPLKRPGLTKYSSSRNSGASTPSSNLATSHAGSTVEEKISLFNTMSGEFTGR